jgi:hypothetical protein
MCPTRAADPCQELAGRARQFWPELPGPPGNEDGVPLEAILAAALGQRPEVAAYAVRCGACWADSLCPCLDRRPGLAGRATRHPHRERVLKAVRRGIIGSRRLAREEQL